MKQTIHINKNKLLSLVKETVERIVGLQPDTTFDLSRYLDRIPIQELEQQYEDYTTQEYIHGFDTLDESISIDDVSRANDVAKSLKEKYNFKDWQVIVLKGNHKVEVIIVYAGIFKNTKKIKGFMMEQHFFESKSWWARKKYMLWKAIKFEPMKQTDLTEEAKKYGVLYHITQTENTDSIFRNGLVPSHKNKNFKYPDRVYVICGNTSEAQIIYLGEQLFKSSKTKDGKYTLFAIKTNQIPNDIRFFGDPNYKFGYFTEQVIPPQAISKIKDYNFGSVS